VFDEVYILFNFSSILKHNRMSCSKTDILPYSPYFLVLPSIVTMIYPHFLVSSISFSTSYCCDDSER